MVCRMSDRADVPLLILQGIGVYDRKTQSYRYIKRFWTDETDVEAKEKRMRANDGEASLLLVSNCSLIGTYRRN